jgi:hypothetical protein
MLSLSKYLENLNRKNRFYIPYSKPTEGVEELLKIEKVKSGWVGAFSISTKKTKIYNLEKPSINVDGTELIGTEISKYLILLNQTEGGYRRETAELLEQTPPPLYANPVKLDRAVYVDIKSCYYSLLTKLWGIKYSRGRYLGTSKERGFYIPEQFKEILSEHKSIRNAIYGITRVRTRTKFIVDKSNINFTIEKSRNPLYYPDIGLSILDITQAIGTLAVFKFGAVYVAIDGFIIPEKKLISFIEFLHSLGLQAGIKAEGEVEIKNFYTYSFNTLTSKNWQIIEKAKEIKSNLIFDTKTAEEIIKKFKPFLTSKI